jgi:hypothetical protein
LFAVGTATAQQATTPDNSKRAPRPLAAKQFEVFAPYWTLEPGWHSELMLRNNSSDKQVSVTPILRLSSGNEVKLEPLSLEPNETRTINIANSPALTAAGLTHRSGSYGSVLFRYSAQTAGNIYASVMIHMTERPIAFHYDAFAQAADYPIDGYEGIWWLPEETTQCHLVISNLLEQPVKGTLDVLDSTGEAHSFPLALGPRQTNRFDVRSLVGEAKFTGSTGGIRVRFKASAGATQVAMLNFDEDANFSALMRVFPHESVSPAPTAITLRAPTVALAVPDPALNLPEGTRLQSQIFLRNTTSLPLPIQTMIDWRNASSWGRKSIDVPPIPPNATTVLNLSDLQDRKVISPDANWATVTLDFVGHDGDLVPVTASYADHEQFLMQSPFSDWLSFMWKGGEWEVDVNHNSLITTGNAGTKPTRAAVTIYYDQGKQKYDFPPRTLQPGEAMTINLAELIQRQTPDAGGKALPAALSTGSYEIRDLDSSDGQLYEGKIAIDRTNGHATYGCALCCSYSDAYITDYDGSIGDYGNVQVFAMNSCTESWLDQTSIATGWITGDSGIATVAAGVVHGVGVGSSSTGASVHLRTPQSYKVCPLLYLAPVGLVRIRPTVTIQGNLGYVYIGHDPVVISKNGLFGSGNPNGGTYQWSSPDGSISFDNSAAATAHLTATSYSGGQQDTQITLNYSAGGQSATPALVWVTKRLFYYLAGDTLSPYAIYSGPSNFGWIYYASYNVFTHPDNQQVTNGGDISTYENVSVTSSNIPIQPITQSGALDPNSHLNDQHQLTNNSPFPAELLIVESQDIGVGGLYVRTNTLTWTNTGLTIQNTGSH